MEQPQCAQMGRKGGVTDHVHMLLFILRPLQSILKDAAPTLQEIGFGRASLTGRRAFSLPLRVLARFAAIKCPKFPRMQRTGCVVIEVGVNM